MKPLNYYTNIRTNELDQIMFLGSERVLDVGCGFGASLEYLKQKYTDLFVVGVEPFYKDQTPVLDEIHHCDVQSFVDAYNGPKFDTILCLDVLEHVWEYQAVLDRLALMLTDDGCLLISVPNVSNFRVFWQIFIRNQFPKRTEGIFDATHCRWFTKNSLSNDLESLGFKNITYRYSGLERYKKLFFANILTGGFFQRYLGFQIVALCRK